MQARPLAPCDVPTLAGRGEDVGARSHARKRTPDHDPAPPHAWCHPKRSRACRASGEGAWACSATGGALRLRPTFLRAAVAHQPASRTQSPEAISEAWWDAACVSCQENATLQAAGFANRLEPARRWKALEGHSAPTQAAVMPNIREDRGWGKVLAFLRASGRIRAVGATQQPTAVLASAPPSGRSRPSWSGSTPPTAASSCAPPCSWASGCLPLPPPPDREVRGGRPPSRFGAAARTP